MSKSSENVTEDQQQPGIPGSWGKIGGTFKLAGAEESRRAWGTSFSHQKFSIQQFKQLSSSFQPFSDTLSRREDSSHVWRAT
jgi:hypothetical protein